MNELTRVHMNFGPHMSVYITLNDTSRTIKEKVVTWASEFQERWQSNVHDMVIDIEPIITFDSRSKSIDFDWVVLRYDHNHGPEKYEDVFPLQNVDIAMNGGLFYNTETGEFSSAS